MDNTVSPILQARINQPSVNNSGNIQQTKQNLTTKPDSVELSTKPKMSKGKKALIAAGATIGALAVTAGVIALIHKGHIKSIQKEGASIQEKAQKVVDEFMEKFKNVQPLEDGSKVIEEFAQDGKTLARYATLDVNDFLTINDYANKTRIGALEGELYSFYKKANSSEGGFQYKKGFFFADGKLIDFSKNCQMFADGSSTIDKHMSFDEYGQLEVWEKNQQMKANCDMSSKKIINFKDGKLESIAKNVQGNLFYNEKADRVVFFKDGKLEKLIKNYHTDTKGNETYGKIKYFGKNK